MATDASAHDPYRGFKFKVLITDFPGEIGFQSVAGLSEETEVVEYREGNNPITMRKLPGLTSYENIVLTRGMANDRSILDWRKQVADGPAAKGASGDGVSSERGFRREVTIQLFDKGDDNNPVKQWRVFLAWPARLEISDLDAGSSEVVIETMELAHEGLVQEGVPSRA